MSPMAIDSTGAVVPEAVHDTVLPSAATETMPSFFLYWAAASDMLVGGKGRCGGGHGVGW